MGAREEGRDGQGGIRASSAYRAVFDPAFFWTYNTIKSSFSVEKGLLGKGRSPENYVGAHSSRRL